MISVDGKVYRDRVKFPVTYKPKNEQEKQELIEEYRYLVDEDIGKLLELMVDIDQIEDKVDYKIAKRKNEHIQKIIEYVEWQYTLWSTHIRLEEVEELKDVVNS